MIKKLCVYSLVIAQLTFLGSSCSRDSISGGGTAQGGLSALLSQIDVGLELYKIYHAQLEQEPDATIRAAQLTALELRRDDFIDAINTVVNDQTLPGLESTLEALFQLIDEGHLPALTDEIKGVLEELLQEPARPTIKAIVTLLGDRSAVPTGDVVSLLGRLANYPDAQQLWTAIAELVAANDGVDEFGQSNGEPPLVNDLLGLASRRLQQAPASSTSSFSLAGEAFLDELLEPSKNFGTVNFGQAEWVVRLDARGAPVVLLDPQGSIPAPFVDLNNDALADLDSAGSFRDANGQALDITPFGEPSSQSYDSAGRRIDASGALVFEFFDSKQTLLALFISIAGRIVDQGVHADLMTLLDTALGQRDAQGLYQRFSTAHRMGYAGFELIKVDEVPRAMRAVAELLDKNPDQAEAAVVSIARALDDLRAIPSNGPSLGLSDPQVTALINGLLPALDEIFETPTGGTSTARFLISTLTGLGVTNPDWPAQFGPLFLYSEVTRESTPDGDRNSIDEAASVPVDHSQPSTASNRSAIQQLLAMLKRADQCSFFGQNLAVLFLDAMAGLTPATVNTLVSFVTAVPGLANLACPGISTDIAALDALARSGGLDALLPLAKTFRDQGQTELLVKILVRLERDYLSLIRPLEPSVASIFSSGALEEVFGAVSVAETTFDPVSGVSVADAIADFLAHLVDDDVAVLDPAGQAVPTRAHLLLDPLTTLDADLRALGQTDAMGRLSDAVFQSLFLRTVIAGQERLENQSLLPFLSTSLDIFAQHIPAQTSTRVQELVEAQLELDQDMVSADVVTMIATLDAVTRSAQSATIMTSIARLMTPDQDPAQDRFGALVKVLAMSLQQETDEATATTLAAFAGRAIDPSRDLVIATIVCLERYLVLDQGGSVMNIARAALNPPPSGGDAPINVLSEIFQEVSSAAGGPATQVSEADIVEGLESAVSFLEDNLAGLPFFYEVIRNRNP